MANLVSSFNNLQYMEENFTICLGKGTFGTQGHRIHVNDINVTFECDNTGWYYPVL